MDPVARGVAGGDLDDERVSAALSIAIRTGSVGAAHAWAEVPRVLAKRAAQAGVPFEALERLWWDDYVPLIRVVDCAGLPATRQSRILAGRDDFDTNTLVLAGLIAPMVVIAEDPDILASGLAAVRHLAAPRPTQPQSIPTTCATWL